MGPSFEVLLLKIIHVLVNFLILSHTLLCKYFLIISLKVYFEGNLDCINKFSNMTSLFHSNYTQKLEIISQYISFVILVESSQRFEFDRPGERSPE